MVEPDWLPDRHLGVAATLAHADETIAAVANLLFDYQVKGGDVVRLREVAQGSVRRLLVDSVAPIPQRLSLLAADAFNNLRAAIEHTLLLEAEFAEGGNLDEKSEKLLSMPAARTYDDFMKWEKRLGKNAPRALRRGSELHKRIERLQPFQRYADPLAHPLARLVAHSNHSKHRRPALTAVRIPVVSRDDVAPGRLYPDSERPEVPVVPGDTIFTAVGTGVIPLTIFPTVGVNVPGTERWPVLMNELGQIADWVRTQAVPQLITGAAPQNPTIPPWHDISRGHTDARRAIAAGRQVSAYVRNKERMGATFARQDIADQIAAVDGSPPREQVARWLDSLSDRDLLARLDRIPRSTDRAPQAQILAELKGMTRDATAFATASTHSKVD